ncbi:hypothetical protein KUV23_06665 [Algoriphagus marincola]|uniref:Transposase n=1 Tax=Algoriphagus marincola TaxID=264027 RepID=A0ABS7N2X1_9BACT|nr:hypothetical protein [Algoriphagus marincola]MBY5950647.1 hypothetical protein [Algoriphagus marincola]
MYTEVFPKLFIGIDVHKRQWSVSIFTANCHHKIFSQAPDPKALKSYLANPPAGQRFVQS